MSLVPLIVVTAIIEICFFSIRVWVMRKKGHSRGYDDITISIAFVGDPELPPSSGPFERWLQLDRMADMDTSRHFL